MAPDAVGGAALSIRDVGMTYGAGAGAVEALQGISLDIAPVPDANDFRVDVAKEAQDEIRAQITKAVTERQAKMVSDCWTRMRESWCGS